MTKDESKRKILEQWARYMPDPNRAEYQDKLKFYDWLVDAYPELLQWENGTELERSKRCPFHEKLGRRVAIPKDPPRRFY